MTEVVLHRSTTPPRAGSPSPTRDQLDQVLWALLDNAVKYGRREPIEVSIAVEADARPAAPHDRRPRPRHPGRRSRAAVRALRPRRRAVGRGRQRARSLRLARARPNDGRRSRPRTRGGGTRGGLHGGAARGATGRGLSRRRQSEVAVDGRLPAAVGRRSSAPVQRIRSGSPATITAATTPRIGPNRVGEAEVVRHDVAEVPAGEQPQDAGRDALAHGPHHAPRRPAPDHATEVPVRRGPVGPGKVPCKVHPRPWPPAPGRRALRVDMGIAIECHRRCGASSTATGRQPVAHVRPGPSPTARRVVEFARSSCS